MHLNTKYTKNSRQNKSQLSNVIGSAIDDDDADAGADVLVDADVDVGVAAANDDIFVDAVDAFR